MIDPYKPAQIDPNILLLLYAQAAQKQQQQPSVASGVKDIVSSAAKKKATSAIKSAISGSSANELASTAAQNSLFNSGAMQAGGKLASSAAENVAYNQAATQAGGGLAQTGILSNAAGMGALPIAAIAGATALGGKAALDMLKGKKPSTAGRVVLGMATGGLSEVANKIFSVHKSTRDVAKETTNKLLSRHKDDPQYQSYVSAMREQYNSAPPDPSKPFAGKYATWDEYKKAGLEAGDLTGVEGNIDTFQNKWTGLDFNKQKEITQALIDANLYDSRKSGVVITDRKKAEDIFNKITSANNGSSENLLSNANKFANALNEAPVNMIPKAPQRTAGFDWNGKNFVKRK